MMFSYKYPHAPLQTGAVLGSEGTLEPKTKSSIFRGRCQQGKVCSALLHQPGCLAAEVGSEGVLLWTSQQVARLPLVKTDGK